MDAEDKIKAILELTEPFLKRSGRYWGVDIILHKKHREYVNEIMWIIEGSEFKEKPDIYRGMEETTI